VLTGPSVSRVSAFKRVYAFAEDAVQISRNEVFFNYLKISLFIGICFSFFFYILFIVLNFMKSYKSV